jgi:flagellar hook-associated protein 1 FlgK
MASIFNSLHIGYSGLNAAQVGVDVTSHNIANVDTEGYTRQRVVTAAAHPVNLTNGVTGNGTRIIEIASVFDQFVFDRYVSAGEDKANSDFKRNTLEELSTYFPDIDGVGIKADLNSYFDLWQSFSDNPDNEAMKIALAQQTQTLSQTISQTRDQVTSLQNSIDAQMVTYVNEVNSMAKEISQLNVSINQIESISEDNANDLRDKRNLLEQSIAKLIGGEAFVGLIESNTQVDSNIAIEQGQYSLQIAGFNIVDGSSFHPIGVTNATNAHGFHDLYYERQDQVQFPFEQTIKGGKIGAILELRGSEVNSLTGEPENGILQDTVNMLDAFSAGLIENTNNIYAQNATTKMQSNNVDFDNTRALVNTERNFEEGSFDIIIYDIDGNTVASRTIAIDSATQMDGSTNTITITHSDGSTTTRANSIVEQISAAEDGNDDGSAINDVDDYINPVYTNPSAVGANNGLLSFSLQPGYEAQGYTFAIVDSPDNGTNFAGVMGMHRFFDGSNAKDIELNRSLANDTSKMSAAKAPIAGDNEVATKMVAMQFDDLNFYNKGNVYRDSIYGFYDSIVTEVGTKTNAEIIRNDTLTAHFNAVSLEFDSISKVSIDEELTNLIRYQTAYGAASKVITTIDQMMTTLLGIKQ